MTSHEKDKRELRTGRKPSATTSELSLGKNPQLQRLALRLNTGGYNHINPRLEASWNRRSTHDRHENIAEQPEGQRELQRKNSKGLGLHWFYISNTQIGGDHVPLIIQTMHGSSSIVHPCFK